MRVPTCICALDPNDPVTFFEYENHAVGCPVRDFKVRLDVIYTDENGVPDGGKHAEALLKRRAGDQPLPTESDSPSMHDLVCEDMQGRKAVGLSRYGRALQANNGRDGMRDAYEEALDLCAYLRQLLYERDGR